jgi:hypothetical protein
MGKSCHNDFLDAALDALADNVNKLVILSGAPAAYADTQADVDDAGLRLAEIAVTSADFTGPDDGETSGRKLIVNAQDAVTITGNEVTGDTAGTHYALIDTVLTQIWYVTTCTSQVHSFNSEVDVPAFTIELRDPA